MKSFYFILPFTILPIGLALAQTSSAANTTKPASITVVPNRQQELYDQYHGITKKPTTSAPTTTPNTSRTESQRSVNTPITQPATAASTNPLQRVAPPSKPSKVRIGARGGVTYPIFTETEPGIDPAIGFVGGLVFNFGMGKVSFQPEVNYTRYSTKVTAFNFTDSKSVDALEVPLFLKLSTGTYAGNRFFLNIGPYAAYSLSTSTNGKTNSLDGTTGRFGFGAAAGVGVALKAGPGHVIIEVRGLYPLGNIDSGFNTDSRTILGQGTLGYSFPLGGR